MSFEFDLTDQLRDTIKKLKKKDPKRVEILKKKIKEVVNHDHDTISHYKNLQHDLKEFKRVHVDRSFVLVFKVFENENFALFDRLEHHDKVYTKKRLP
ncbi:MAG: addiction module toxin RelE [Candidatus Diapherotrites archaeon]|nr:addiction module toxin RelE [Candidatus Diapherotrites archaeon]